MKNSLSEKWYCIPLHNRFVPVLFYLTLLLLPLHFIHAHGTVTSPPSRVWVCFQENPESPDSPACEAAIIGWGTQAFYDWSEVARMDANGMHQAIISDGNLASAGRPDKFGGIDQVRDDWVATPVTAGPFQVIWTNSAPHQTLYYDVYITKADWTPDQPLTWDSLEKLVRTPPRPAAATDIIDVVLPPRTGKHVIYSVWQRSLTPEAFYSTSDVDFGNAAVEPVAPVASFTSDNLNRCGGPEVTFDASDSYDANGDALSYSWDFGDGTTAEGVEVTHIFPDNLDNALVTLTVSDGSFSSGTDENVNLKIDPDCAQIVCPFDTPRASPLPTLQGSYRGIFVVGENGPVFDDHKWDINWNLSNNGLYQFSIQSFGGASIWTNLLPNITQNFNQANPEITFSGTRFEGLNGSYYVSVDGDNFILVSKTGDFTIYLSEFATDDGPDCGENPTTDPIAGGTITGGPFEFILGDGNADFVSGITLSGEEGENSQWVISNEDGLIVGLPVAPEDFNFDITQGRTFIHHLSYNGTIQNLEVGNSVMALIGEFDFSNSIDVSNLIDTPIDYENVVYSEEVDGDLSDDNEAPTTVEFNLGDNRVISSQGQTVGRANFFTFQIPEGHELSQLILDSYEGTDDIGFIGIDEGTIIGGQPANNAPSRLIGGLSYGTANIGNDILPEMGDLSNPAAPFIEGFGFTPPLEAGNYTVWLNQTGITSETVLNFVITEVEITTPPAGDCTFNTPLNTALPTTGNTAYENVYVLGSGGPNMDSVQKFVINWDLENNGLYQFSFNLNVGPWYINFSDNEQNFDEIYPGIFLTGTGIAGLDGYYYVTMDEGNFVMVADGYTIYFSNSDTAPDCEEVTTGSKVIEKVSTLSIHPNPAITNFAIENDTNLEGASISISDLNGIEIKSLLVTKNTTLKSIDVSEMDSGLYLVRIVKNDGFSRTLKLIVE